jgi:hypothetical protein
MLLRWKMPKQWSKQKATPIAHTPMSPLDWGLGFQLEDLWVPSTQREGFPKDCCFKVHQSIDKGP